MTAILQSTRTGQVVTPLDALWALYQSQPKRVQKAFRVRLAEEKAAKVQWKVDMQEIKSLKANWDEEGAPTINRASIRHTQKLLTSLDVAVACHIRLYPTHLGAVMLKMETEKGRIKAEIGDKQMSYFVKRPSQATEHHSFENIYADNIALLIRNLNSLV